MPKHKSNRRSDYRRTERIEELTNSAYANNGFALVERVTDKERQLKGIDVIISKNGKEYIIDEKAAIQYYDRDLKTYSLEVYSENNPNCKGWFTNSDMINDYYAFIYPRSIDKDLLGVTSMEIIIVEKERIKEYLKQFISLNVSDIRMILDMFGRQNNGRLRHVINENIALTQSIELYERPINIVLSKKVLIELADAHIYEDYISDDVVA